MKKITLAIYVSMLTAQVANAQFGSVLDRAKRAAEKVKTEVKGPPQPGEAPHSGGPAGGPGQGMPSGRAQTPASTQGQGAAADANWSEASSGSATLPDGQQKFGEFLPLTQWRAVVLLFRDNPNLMTENALFTHLLDQVAGEANLWGTYDNRRATTPGHLVAPPVKKFIFEWQKYIDQQPELARGPLMDVFMRGDADWSFVERQKGWDENPTNIVDVVVFAKEAVVDREAQFAAQALMPVYRKHLDLAISKATTKFFFDAPLPLAAYDFGTKSFRFVKQGTAAANVRHEFVEKAVVLKSWEPGDPLAAASLKSRANYYTFSADQKSINIQGENTNRPQGRLGWSGPETWRRNLERRFAAPLIGFSFDRPLEISSFPVDTAKAEALTKRFAEFSARVFIEAEHVYVGLGADNKNRSVIAARVQRVEILGPDHDVLATVSGVAEKGSSPPPAQSQQQIPKVPSLDTAFYRRAVEHAQAFQKEVAAKAPGDNTSNEYSKAVVKYLGELSASGSMEPVSYSRMSACAQWLGNQVSSGKFSKEAWVPLCSDVNTVISQPASPYKNGVPQIYCPR
jgi:hypothetical protein